MEKCLIVAVADNMAIGKDNRLLWHISEDLQYFKKVTAGSPVIMGYMTFKSIGRLLPRRKNICISLFPFPDAPAGLVLAGSLDEAFAEAARPWAPDGGVPAEPERCFVMGGGYTYREAMGIVDTLYITHVHTVIVDADTFFPDIDPSVWEVASKSEQKTDPETGYKFEFLVYKRK